MKKFGLWFSIIRPRTLFASVCPVLIGLVALGNIPRPWVAAVTLCCALALQILSNLINDYYDFVRGADKQGRVGPKRALAEGLVTRKQMLHACIIDAVICVVLGALLIGVGGWPIVAVGVSAMLFAWLYTATRHSLSYLGIADIFCFLYYGPVAAAGTAFLQTGALVMSAVWAGCACGCIAVCVLATNNIRDVEDDRGVGKRTIPVRMGVPFALVCVALLLVGVDIFSMMAFGKPVLLVFTLAAVWVYVRLLRAQGAGYNKVLFYFGLLNAFYVMLAMACVWLG